MSQFDFEDNSTTNDNYPIETDTAFTPDEIESIKAYKDKLTNKLNKNRSVLKGLEVSFWGITSYSLAIFLVLTSGTQGIGLAIAACLLINQITNRDCLDAFNVNRRDGQFEVDGMGKLVKFGFSTLVSAFVIWSALGNFIQVVETSKHTYNRLQDTVTEFNKLPSDKQNAIFIIGGLLGLAGIYTLIDGARRR